MFAPLIAGYVHAWPEQLAIFLLIALLAFYSVHVRARRARRDRKPFPIGSLVLCSCLFFGFAMGLTEPFRFADLVGFGLFAGIVAGGSIGMIRAWEHAEKARKPVSRDGLYDREIDQ